MKKYDLIIVGCGAMGAAALYQAAKQGVNVLGIDRYHPPHEMGSSHAETRFTRLGVGEGPQYGPLVARSHEIWRELEAASGETIFYQDGLLIVAPKGEMLKEKHNHWENFVERSAEVAAEIGVPFEILQPEEIRARFPKIMVTDQEYAGFEPTGGHVMAEVAVAVQLKLAQEHGATFLPNSPVSAIEQNDADENGRKTVTVTAGGETFVADQVLITAGAWLNDFLPSHQHKNFRVTRQIVFWFEVDEPAEYHPENMPGVLWVGQRLEDYFAAFALPPGAKPGLKVLTEQYDVATNVHQMEREISAEETDAFYKKFGSQKIAGLKPNCLKSSVCIYTHTPDDHFVIDWHPEYDRNVMVVSACSSHGFKHSAAIGEAVVQKMCQGKSEIPLTAFAWERLSG